MADSGIPDQRDCHPAWWRRDWFLALVLVAATFGAYSSCAKGSFIWDDHAWTRERLNLMQDFSGLCRMWDTPKALQQYYPLAGTTFWLDHRLWGDWTMPYHLENIFWHVASALLFGALLRRLKLPGWRLAAAIFALHPMMVESVAWITERKNVLCVFFFLGALLAYGRFDSFWEENAPRRRWAFYFLALVLFPCALLSKVTAFVFPPVILLLCWWKRGRIRWGADLLPVLPFFALAVADGLLIMGLENDNVGARLVGLDQWPWTLRCIIAGRAFWFYPWKLLWPTNLCFIYPSWQMDPSRWWEWLFPISAVAALLTLWLMRRRWGRGPACAAFFYVGALFPVMGFMNVFGMYYSYVWDHWVYLPGLGLIALAAAGLGRLMAQLAHPAVRGMAMSLFLSILGILTWRQGRMYQDMETLWLTVLDRYPACWMARNNLGVLYMFESRRDDAIHQFELAIQARPDLSMPHTNLGATIEMQGKLDEAISQYQAAIKVNPDDNQAQRAYAAALLKKGRGGEALTHLYYRDARVAPDRKNWGGMERLAWILATCPNALLRDGPIAVQLAGQANEVSLGKSPDVLQTLAAAYAESGQYEQAVRTAEKALALAAKHPGLAAAIAEQLNGYRAGKPFRDPKIGIPPDLLNIPTLPASSRSTG